MDKIATIIVSVLLSLIAAGIVATAVAPQQMQQAVGSLAGPVIPSPYIMWGGVSEYNGTMAMRAATTTVCAIQSPAATSTLTNSIMQIRTGGTVTPAATFSLATSSNQFATTTNNGALLANQVYSASTTQEWSYDPTSNANIMAPNSWLLFKAVNSSAPAGGYTFTGTCNASFTAIQ